MWLATRFGFFSIVQKQGQYFVRARKVADLKSLKKQTGLKNKIVQIKNTDYVARIILSPSELKRVRDVLFATIGYSNFKDCIKDTPSQKDKLPYYHEVWGQMWDYQHGKVKAKAILDDEPDDVCAVCDRRAPFGTMRIWKHESDSQDFDLICTNCDMPTK